MRRYIVVEIVGTFLLVSVVNATVDPQRAGAIIHISALGPLAIGMVWWCTLTGVTAWCLSMHEEMFLSSWHP